LSEKTAVTFFLSPAQDVLKFLAMGLSKKSIIFAGPEVKMATDKLHFRDSMDPSVVHGYGWPLGTTVEKVRRLFPAAETATADDGGGWLVQNFLMVFPARGFLKLGPCSG